MGDPISYTIKGAVAATGIPRSKIYLAIANGWLVPRKAGRTTLILHSELVALVAALPTQKEPRRNADDVGRGNKGSSNETYTDAIPPAQ